MSISASEARQRLFPLIEQVNTDHQPVRISISSHFGGVRTGRSHARESSQGPNQQ